MDDCAAKRWMRERKYLLQIPRDWRQLLDKLLSSSFYLTAAGCHHSTGSCWLPKTEDMYENTKYVNQLSFHSQFPQTFNRIKTFNIFYLFDSNNSIPIWFGTIRKCQWAQSQIWFLNIQILSKPHSTRVILWLIPKDHPSYGSGWFV